jgi:AAA domain-containing protein
VLRVAEIIPLTETRQPRLGIRLSTVERERVEWLWDHRIPLGKITLIDGDPGLGKSLVSVDIAARITRGRRMPDGSPGFEGDVVMMSAEDGLGDTIRPRLELAGANLDRVTSLATLPAAEGQERVAVLPDDLPQIIAVVQETAAVLVIIDPLMAFLSSRINAHRDQDIRRALAPLALAANKYRFAVLIIRHLNKSSTTTNPLYRGGGSIGIGGAARSAMVVAEDPDNHDRRILAPTKSNLGPRTTSLAYRIEAEDDTPRVVWDGTSEHVAETLLTQTSAEERSQRTIAKDFLRETLADGSMDSAKIYGLAENLDLKRNTVWRAKKELGIRARKTGFASGWAWELPSDAS